MAFFGRKKKKKTTVGAEAEAESEEGPLFKRATLEEISVREIEAATTPRARKILDSYAWLGDAAIRVLEGGAFPQDNREHD